MGGERDIRAAAIKLIKSQLGGVETFVASVKDVDETRRTCTLLPVNGDPELYHVRLKPTAGDIAEGIYAIPEEKSFVIAAALGNENNIAVLVVEKAKKYIINCVEDGKVEINGSNYSALKTEDFITEIKKLKAAVKQIKSALENGAVASDGSGAGYKASITALLASFDTGSFDNLKSDKVKHG